MIQPFSGVDRHKDTHTPDRASSLFNVYQIMRGAIDEAPQPSLHYHIRNITTTTRRRRKHTQTHARTRGPVSRNYISESNLDYYHCLTIGHTAAGAAIIAVVVSLPRAAVQKAPVSGRANGRKLFAASLSHWYSNE